MRQLGGKDRFSVLLLFQLVMIVSVFSGTENAAANGLLTEIVWAELISNPLLLPKVFANAVMASGAQ